MSNALVTSLLGDLTAEGDALDAVAGSLDDAGWHTPTPAEGWDVADTIAHLGATDAIAVQSATDGPAFAAWLEREVVPDLGASYLVRQLEPARTMAPAELLAWWRAGRATFVDVMGDVDPDIKLPWFGPPMKPASFVTARLMETWAHGLDVADALGVPRIAPSDRLRHVVEIAFRTRGWSYVVRGLTPPPTPLRLELAAPSGETWTWGPEDAPDVVRGSALEFCLVAVQRLHRADAALETSGDRAEEWLAIAQAYAGPPGPGRPPRG